MLPSLRNYSYALMIISNLWFVTQATPPLATWIHLNAAAVQTDGKIVAAGETFNTNINSIIVVRYTSSGAVDTTFGTNGTTITTLNDGCDCHDVAIDSSGNILVGGSTTIAGVTYFALLRYTSAGVLDNTFGTSGVATTLINDSCEIRSIAIQTNGMIVAAGSDLNSGNSEFALARYSTAGVLDATFGTSGTTSQPINSNALAHAMVIQTDGAIVLAGASLNGSITSFTLARFTSAGALDTTFGTSGITVEPIGNADIIKSMVLQSGNIVVAGMSDQKGVLARFTTLGVLDTSFGTSGITLFALDTETMLRKVMLQTTGKIVTVGYADNQAITARFTSTGSLDTSFNTVGYTFTTIGRKTVGHAAVLQTNDQIISVGMTDNNALLIRYNADGTPDANFALSSFNFLVNGYPLQPSFIGEIQFNPNNLVKDTLATLDIRFNTIYGITPPLIALRAWLLPLSTLLQQPITLQFVVPGDFDSNGFITLEAHFFIDSAIASGSVINLRLRFDARANAQIVGTAAPASGFLQTALTGDVTVTPIPTTTNVKHYYTITPLSTVGVNPRDMATLVIDRAATTGTEYSNDIYLTSIVFRYKRL